MTDARLAQIKESIESSQHVGWAAELLAALEAERAKLARVLDLRYTWSEALQEYIAYPSDIEAAINGDAP